MAWKNKRNVSILNNILLLPAEGNLEGNRIGCHTCSAKNKAKRMKFKCPKCNKRLCAIPCGEVYGTKLHF
jgi:Zn finger protein HypA/HybF involved in hydrogenase expression